MYPRVSKVATNPLSAMKDRNGRVSACILQTTNLLSFPARRTCRGPQCLRQLSSDAAMNHPTGSSSGHTRQQYQLTGEYDVDGTQETRGIPWKDQELLADSRLVRVGSTFWAASDG